MSQGVCVMEAADASGSTADFFLEVYQSRVINVHVVVRHGIEQKMNRLWFSDSHLFLNVRRFETLFSHKICLLGNYYHSLSVVFGIEKRDVNIVSSKSFFFGETWSFNFTCQFERYL